MCEWGTQRVVTTPDWIWESRSHPENGIAIDSCITDTILDAWARGVRTLGSCCGHGKDSPSVVLTEDKDQVDLARAELPGFSLFQWQLVDVTEGNQT